MMVTKNIYNFREKWSSPLKAALVDESTAETVHLETTEPEQTKNDVVMVTKPATKWKEEKENCKTESTQEGGIANP